jgi:hypothetical protein
LRGLFYGQIIKSTTILHFSSPDMPVKKGIIKYMIDNIFKPTLDWIQDDYRTNPLRFGVELVAWAISIGCSITMAVTVPTPPLIILYPIWISGCAMYSWAAFTRKSFGMLANYTLLVSIDMIGLIRMIVNG